MTPTPEEIKNKVAKNHDFDDWNELVDYCLEAGFYKDLDSYHDEAMQEYEEALYTERIKKAGGELPSDGDFKSWFEEKRSDAAGAGQNIYGTPTIIDVYLKMKQAASLVLAKEREKYKELNERFNFLNDMYEKTVKTNNSIKNKLEQKDKEIERLEKDDRLTKINFWARLKSFVSTTNVCDPMSEEEKEMIINICNEKITTNTKTK